MKGTLSFKLIVVIFFAGIFLCSCTEEPEIIEVPKERIFKGFPVILDSVIRTKDGIVRGIELGDSAKKLSVLEIKKPEESDADYSLYFYDADTLNTYTVAYSFVKDTITEVEIQINSKNLDSITNILAGIKKYYSEKYTAPLMDNGIYVFNCFDSKKRNFMISITDNSTAETGILNLLFYREDK